MTPKNLLITAISVAGLGGMLTLIGMASAHWIQIEVADQLASAGIVPEADVTALDTRINNLETLHDKDVLRVETKAEAIARILMED